MGILYGKCFGGSCVRELSRAGKQVLEGGFRLNAISGGAMGAGDGTPACLTNGAVGGGWSVWCRCVEGVSEQRRLACRACISPGRGCRAAAARLAAAAGAAGLAWRGLADCSGSHRVSSGSPSALDCNAFGRRTTIVPPVVIK